MISKKMQKMVKGSSIIRAMFEEGNRLASIYGKENVYDFSLGNPNVPAPKQVKESIKMLVDTYEEPALHGYMNNAGFEDVRTKIANSINTKFSTNFNKSNIIMTVGAAGGINVIFKTLLDPNDEVITFAPFFGEYTNYADNFDAKLVIVPTQAPEFYPDLEKLASAITKKTKIVIINNPNNPTGVIYSEDMIIKITKVLEEKQKELDINIYIFSDEPYRELAYNGTVVPYITKYYKNTVVGYSYSKSLSLAGERIGYLVLPTELDCYKDIFDACSVANRILGFVNAPSLIQKVVGECLECQCDINYYKHNADLIYNGLTKIGFECVKPQGAFYLFVKSPIEDEKEFCQMAKKYNILLVPSSAFGCKGYIRLAYCVATKTIENSLPNFEKLYQDIKNK